MSLARSACPWPRPRVRAVQDAHAWSPERLAVSTPRPEPSLDRDSRRAGVRSFFPRPRQGGSEAALGPFSEACTRQSRAPVPASRHRVTSPVGTSSQKMESQGKQSGWAAALTRSNPTGAIHGIIPPFGQTLPRARRRKGRGTQAARCAVPSVAGRHPVSSARGRIRPSSEYPRLPESSRDPSLTEDSGCGKIS